jgi:hypothetical protein
MPRKQVLCSDFKHCLKQTPGDGIAVELPTISIAASVLMQFLLDGNFCCARLHQLLQN